ncbi:Na/Pi cotransporter family protein [Paenibacillus barcinonensis]|uniref:Na/Pi cotransporter family protein n=1 Tax=Paenibacillus barcinonensis TaxID=198119 RepID=A0A2V4VMF4_PAEBA|nr:Na/Pi symporter [Paenibacillus barcinonensis]PYE47462.1 phosphate:Na+ symporter [Paenibacillus barcinonensis]QKS56377.1 Na/Pi cotransporter family protein [Paenibacillus barcinonensis]
MFRDIMLPLLYGLIIFFGGMKLMEVALQRMAGPMLAGWLNRATSAPWKGMAFSAGATALLQSSTAVTVLTIGLANARLISYGRTLGIILGTNIGTCLTTELVGLQLGQAALPLLLVSLTGWAIFVILVERNQNAPERIRHTLGNIQFSFLATAGFALVMTGIQVMQSIAVPLRSMGVFQWFLDRSADSLWWGFLAGACLTALIHSSAAVISMAITLAATGVLPVEIGIAIVIGSNVGTCITAVIAAAGGASAGKFVAASHVVLNIAGALLFMPLIGQLHAASAWLSADNGAQIAHAQTLFNIISSLLALPFCYLPIWHKKTPVHTPSTKTSSV